jgi:hypothetical protein
MTVAVGGVREVFTISIVELLVARAPSPRRLLMIEGASV